jgi:hypothetical protein
MAEKKLGIDPGHGMGNTHYGKFDTGAVNGGLIEAKIAEKWAEGGFVEQGFLYYLNNQDRVDYGLGNLGSIRNMLRRVGAESVVSGEPEVLNAAERLILPGVGAFDAGMEQLAARGLIPVLERRVLTARIPTLGLCLGMQLLGCTSEEGHLPGLGWIARRSGHAEPR